MWSEYDENLSDNPFLNEIITNHSDILKKASEESWIICVPRKGSFELNQITIDNILDHILIPNYEAKTITYTTLSKKPVKINNKQIQLEGNDNSLCNQSNSIQILFDETFYIERTLKYIVWCLESPLFIDYIFCDTHQPKILETFQDCLDFLWTKNNNIFEQIQSECTQFLDNHKQFETENLQTQKESIGNLYSHCLQITFKNTDLNTKIAGNESLIEKFKLSVETYMQYCLKTTLIKSINSFIYENDAYLNKIIRNSNDLHLNDLNISSTFCDIITNAKCELTKLNNYVTIIDKIYCLKSTFKQLCKNKNFCLNSDDFLQIFVFLILRLNINNWIANLIYLTQFRFSTLNLNDQNNFLLTTLEAAIEFIKSNQFLDIKTNFKMQIRNEGNDIIFNLIRLNDLNGLKQLINNRNVEVEKQCELIKQHHPLCDCENCLKNFENPTKLTNNKLINDKGQSLLIVASHLGQRDIVEYLINQTIIINDLNYYDYFGRTALHYACIKGYQDILLILLNSSKIDTNLKDNDGNNCLNLAANYGHENCIKALLYSLKYCSINNCNKFGETALHLAVRWNFVEIIKILLENHALTNIYNKRNQLPIHLANNYYVRNILKDSTIDLLNKPSTNNRFVIIEPKSINFNNKNCKEHGIRPKTIEQFKRIDLLLKAIENNDLPLTCYYLGFKNITNSTETELTTKSSKCHPLCNCDKCSIDNLDSNQATIKQLFPLQHLNVNTCNADGFTPLHFAAKYGRNEILRLLLDSQASPNIKSYKTLQTPLHLACVYQRIQIVRELVKCGDCQIDCYDYKGNTPLYYACIKNDSRIVEVLLSNGADCNVCNHKGDTIFGEVQDKMFYGVLKLLKDHSKVDLDTEDFLF